MKKLVSLLVLVVVVGGGFGVWYYFVRDDAPAELEQTTRTTVGSDGGPDGAYSAVEGADTVAGFRIDEKFGPLDHTAVVRTSGVSGSFSVQGTTISNVKITVDMTTLESKDEQPPGPNVANRIRFLKDGGLETDRFPAATFETASITLPQAPTKGTEISVDATGTLTLHGVAKEVTIPLKATWNGAVIDVSGQLEIALADYGMEPPSLAFVTVTDKGTMEFKAAFAQ